MADEFTSLISVSRVHHDILSSFIKKLKLSCVRSKGAQLVVVWSVLLVTSYTNIQVPININNNISLLSYSILLILTVLFPVLAVIGDKWMRYKVLIVGSLIMIISCAVMLVIKTTNQFIHINDTITAILSTIVNCPYIFGLILFLANFIQFGTDQLPFSSSQELSSFIYWCFWPYYFCVAVIGLVQSAGMAYFAHKNASLYDNYVMLCFVIMFIAIALLFVCCFKHHLIIQPAQHNNPFKLIWRVMRYAWKHKQPVRRSAFTYGEPLPSRLDLAKERYGGLFSTEQVENVKSFCYISSILIAAYGVTLYDDLSNLSSQYFSVLNQQSNRTVVFTETVVLAFPLTIPFSLYALIVPIFQFIIVPFFSCFIPSMLKRMWIGLVVLLLQLSATTAIAVIVNKDVSRVCDDCVCFDFSAYNSSFVGMEIFTLPYPVFIVPQMLLGLCIVLLFITGFEFILAQGPRSMQGLLIGLWLIGNTVHNINNSILPFSFSCRWEYYAVKTCLVLLSIIVYTIAAYKYKYRQRNELSDVNERVIITQYTEKQLDDEEKYERLESNKLLYDIDSMVVN